MTTDFMEKHKGDFLKFLGTAGARFVVSQQLRASGGLWLSAGGEQVLIDPGPGALVRCISSRPKLDPFTLSSVILTHRHLDHSNDVNIIIEAMTNGGRNKKGVLYAPGDAFNSSDPVVQPYVRSFLQKTVCLEEGKIIQCPSFTLMTPVRHRHPVETYGLRFFMPYGNISLISDTAFFPELITYYKETDLLIINVVIFKDHTADKIYHLNFKQAAQIIKGIAPKAAVLTHFGMTMLQNKPFFLAQRLQEELGIKIIAARDGLKLEMESMFSRFGN